MKKEEIKVEFESRLPKFRKLSENIDSALEGFLESENISILSITHRVKTFESFWEKIYRKGYKNPFNEIADICGIRIIVYFPSDIRLVGDLIKREFDVIESVDKSTDLESDQFGYRSDHFIVSLKKEWLEAPNWRGLQDFKAEIQVRTILMHSWADLSHKLAYKKEASVPKRFMRELYQLSALFELADEKFEDLRNKKKLLVQEIVSSTESTGFDVTQELNIDVLQTYLNYRFPDRESSSSDAVLALIEEMAKTNVTLSLLDELYRKAQPKLQAMEQICLPVGRDFDEWAQLGMVRMILEHFHDQYGAMRGINRKEHSKVMALFK